LQRVETPATPAPGARGPNFPIGTVTFITCFVEPTYLAFFAELKLTSPDIGGPTTVTLFASEPRLQSLLQMSVANKTEITCVGPQFADLPAVEGHIWPPGSIVYNLTGIVIPSQP